MGIKEKNVAVLVADDYEDLEAWYPILRLREAGAEVTIIASDNVSGNNCCSKHGYEIEIDKKAAEVNPENYDAVVIPGGWAPDILRRCENTLNLVQELSESNKVVAAICHGGWVLASAGVVQGKTLTSTPAIKDDLVHAGADWIDEEVVVDFPLITSRSPEDLPAFSRAILNFMDKRVCSDCGEEYDPEEEGSWYYCSECGELYCPDCIEENEIRSNKTEELKQKQRQEKKQLDQIEQSKNIDEYKRVICPRCDTEMMPF